MNLKRLHILTNIQLWNESFFEGLEECRFRHFYFNFSSKILAYFSTHELFSVIIS